MIHQEERIYQAPLTVCLDPNGHTVFPRDFMICSIIMLRGCKHVEGSVVTMTVINEHSFRYDVMLGIYYDYDVLLITERF